MKKLLIPFIVVIAGCTPVRVVSTEQVSEDFDRYQSFNFYSIDPSADRPYIGTVKDAIASELKSKGYELSDSPDLLINIGTNVEDKVQTRETDYRDIRYMGQRNYTWESEEVIVNEYREGTAVIDVVDASTDELVWQGVAAGTISGKEETMKKRIEKGIGMVLRDFPVR